MYHIQWRLYSFANNASTVKECKCLETSLGEYSQSGDSNHFVWLVCVHISMCLSALKQHEWCVLLRGSMSKMAPGSCIKSDNLLRVSDLTKNRLGWRLCILRLQWETSKKKKLKINRCSFFFSNCRAGYIVVDILFCTMNYNRPASK